MSLATEHREHRPAHAPIPAAAPLPGAPADAVFESWAQQGLVWLPEVGMGRLRVHAAPYDAGYFAKYEGYARTQQGVAITEARVDLVRQYTDRHVVDVGIGCGAFIAARMGWTWGYDVNPEGLAWLHAQGRFQDPYTTPVESVSLWDVLEHLPDPARLLDRVSAYVFTSVPIVPEGFTREQLMGWRHYRPEEHCWYWTHKGLVAWFEAHGFQLCTYNRDEERLGRHDVGSYVFRRAQPRIQAAGVSA